MVIAIQNTEVGFTREWIAFCEKNLVEYELIDIEDPDFINKIKKFELFLWDYDLMSQRDYVCAKAILSAVEYTGVKVFPDYNCRWHYDDKLAQKYLLESISAPLISTAVFYDPAKALSWIATAKFPKVFKLRGGASSINVKLVKTRKEAEKLIKKAFSCGFKPNSKIFYLKEDIRKFRSRKKNFIEVFKSLCRFVLPVGNVSQISNPERGYVYFQDFIPDNNGDLRLVVVNRERMFGLRRYNREGDFRASGSGNYDYLSKGDVNLQVIEMAFKIADDLKMDSIAYDIVFDESGNAKIIEISYSYVSRAYNACPGYWDKQGNWYFDDDLDYQGWMIEKLLSKKHD